MFKRPKTTKYKGITRIDRPEKSHVGFMVRVRWNNESHQAFFNDKKYGDRLGALSAAVEWRDMIERKIGKPRTEERVFSHTTSSTGVLGVYERRRDGKVSGYVATWIDADGRMVRKLFSISKLGPARSLQAAKKARAQGVWSRLGRKVARSAYTAHKANQQPIRPNPFQ